MASKILIVGAGPGGLASALRLIAQGYDVEIFEAADRVGGRMAGFEKDGYAFDTGPTILQLPRLYDELFAAAGLRREDYIQFHQLEPYTRVRFWDDTELDFTTDLKTFKRRLFDLRPDLPEAFDRWYAEHIRKYELGYEPYLGTPPRSLLGYAKPDEIFNALSFRPWETLYQHLWRFFQDDRLVYGLGYSSKYLGMHPTVCASIFSLIPYIEFADGVWHPQGGFRALAQAMGKAITDTGGKIHLNTPVQQVWVEAGETKGVILQTGERVSADAVVVNADLAHAMNGLIPNQARGRFGPDRLKTMQFSCSTFMLYLGIDRRYENLPHHQIYLSDNVRKRERPWLDDSALDEADPPFYVCNPSIIDPANAPPGHSTLYVLVPIPNTRYDVDWAVKAKAYRDFVVSRLPKLGFENVAQHVASETCYTADTWQDDYRVHLGAVFNISHTWTQLGPFRPPIRSDAAKGLYWVGGAVHPGSGLLTILEAAKSVTHFVSQDCKG
ncbi:MAG: phytoene desaturase family protein [Cyanobacteria bacterium P01_A01_bin.114]